MNFEFSNRISGVKASAIREILKMMNDPEIISFGGGNPASETFPVEQLKRISDDIFNTCPNSILEYGITEGDGRDVYKRQGNNYTYPLEFTLKKGDDGVIVNDIKVGG